MKRLIKRKVATVVLLTASLAAFATLGDGGGKKGQKLHTFSPNSFSLRSGYNYKSNNLFTSRTVNYLTLNTTITLQKGNTTYVMPMKRKILLDKIKFNPAPNRY